jgi:hypothetical protein
VECKFWLYPDKFDIEEAFAYNASPADLRAVRKIIFEHFDYIIGEYEILHGGSI